MNNENQSSCPEVSKSTRSKILRHCGGVDSRTRQRILAEAPEITYSDKECMVYCVFPDVPNFFWGEVFRGLRDCLQPEQVSVKFNLYTKLGDTDTVLHYLSEAEKLKARVLVIAAVLTPPVRKKLEEMVEGRLIILLSEQEYMSNCFYIGSHSYQDGFDMGTRYLALFRDRRLLMLSAPAGRNISLRLQGFQDALTNQGIVWNLPGSVLELSFDDVTFKSSAAANLAAALAEKLPHGMPYCLYVPWCIPQLPVAIGKLHRPSGQILCLCHDYARKNENEIVLSCCQDAYAQGRKAMEAAITFVLDQEYPKEKNMFLASRII